MELGNNIKIQRIIITIIFASVICGLVFEAIYALPYQDDFDYFLSMKKELSIDGNPFVAASRIVKRYYLSWSGDFVSVFLLSVLNPFNIGGIKAVSALIFLSVIFFVISIVVFSISMAKKVGNGDRYSIGFFFATLLMLGWLSTTVPDELLYWYTCSYSYCLGVSFLFLLVALVIENRHIVIMCVCSFFAIGMSIQTAVIGIGLLAVFWLLDLFDNKKKGVVITIFMLISATIVLAAPGNRARDYSTGATDSVAEQFLQGIANTTRCIARIGLRRILCSPSFWSIVVAVVLISLFTNVIKEHKYRLSEIVRCIIASIVVIYSAVFPVCFGYRLSFMSPRTESIALAVIWVVLICWIFAIAQCIKSLLRCFSTKEKHDRIYALALIGLLFFAFLVSDNAGVRAYKELFSGDARIQWENWNDIYSEVKSSSNQDVMVNINNRYITDLMVKHDMVEYEEGERISNRYMELCGKDELEVNWYAEDGSVYTLCGIRP